MDKEALDKLTEHMANAQNEVFESIEARKGTEYTGIVVRAASSIAVLQAAGAAFIEHPQIDTIEKATNYAIDCVLYVASAEVMRLREIATTADPTAILQLREELYGDIASFTQQAVRRVAPGEGNINKLKDGG